MASNGVFGCHSFITTTLSNGYYAFHIYDRKYLIHTRFKFCPSVSEMIETRQRSGRAATNYHTRAWQTLIYGKECYIVIGIYLPFKRKQFQISLFNYMQKLHYFNAETSTAYNEITPYRRQSKTPI